MTVPSTPRRAGPFNGTGALVSYPFTFKVFAKADLRVQVTDPSGVIATAVLDSGFLVTLNVDQDATPGGEVQYAVGGIATALPTGYSLAIDGEGLVFTQEADLPQGGNFNPVNLENALDRLEMQLQILRTAVDRAVKVPLADATPVGDLPPAALRDGKLAGFDANGDPTVYPLIDGAPGDAGSVVFIQSGTGARGRNLRDKAREIISVADFATYDGVADDTTKVAQAVAEAVARGADLFWPDGSALTTGSIASFHSIKHIGPGRIVRGSDTFYISPRDSQTNAIYVNVGTGNDANDGLSASQPKQTFQGGLDYFKSWTHALGDGVWRLVLAAGTYAHGAFPSSGLKSKAKLEIIGPVAGHPNVPTALIKEGATQIGTGISCTMTDILVRDIKIEDFNGSQSSGAITGNGNQIYLENCHISDCYYGVSTSRGGSVINVKGGILDDCGLLNSTTLVGAGGAAIRGLFHTKFEVGNQGATDLTEGPILSNNVTGLFGQEFCTGHSDWVTYDTNSTGVSMQVGSRINLGGCHFKNNNIAHMGREGGWCDVASNTTYGTGADANDRRSLTGINSNSNGAQIFLDSSLAAINHMLGATEYRFRAQYPNATTSSTSSGHEVDSIVILGGVFTGPAYSQYPASKVRVRVKGVLTGTAGAKNVSIRLASGGVAAVAVFAAAVEGDFEAELECHFKATASQLLTAVGWCNAAVSYGDNQQPTVDMTVDQPLYVHDYVANAADSITVNSIEWFVTGS